MRFVGGRLHFIARAEVHVEAVGDAPGVVGERGQIVEPHPESAGKDAAIGGVGGSEGEVGKGRCGSTRSNLASELAVEIEQTARLPDGEAVEVMANVVTAEFERVRAADYGEHVFELVGNGPGGFRVLALSAKGLNTGDVQVGQTARAVVDVDAGDTNRIGCIEL